MSRSPRLRYMTRPLFDRPPATPGTGSRRARVAWVTAGLALGGIAVTGGAQALSSNGSGSAGTHGSARPTSRPTGSPESAARRVADAKAPARGDDDHSGAPDGRDHRGRPCVHLDAKALAAIIAAHRTADGGVDVPLSATHVSRCKGTGPRPVPTLSPLPTPPTHSPRPTEVPPPSILPHPSHSWTPLPVPPVPGEPLPMPQPLPRRGTPTPTPTMAAPGPATTR